MAGNLQLPETSKRPIPDTNYCLIHGKTKQGNQETNILKRQNNRSVLVKKKRSVLKSAQFFPKKQSKSRMPRTDNQTTFPSSGETHLELAQQRAARRVEVDAGPHICVQAITYHDRLAHLLSHFSLHTRREKR
jgi:hypothetical protein